MRLIREAFLRAISPRQVGRVVAILTGEALSAQTVSKLSRHLDGLVKAFQDPALNEPLHCDILRADWHKIVSRR